MATLSVERFRGCLLGLAAGDALGTSLEFLPPGSFQPLQDMVGGGPFHLQAGEWTDDTSMGLCLAESLIERQRFDPVDQMMRYVRWYREGYLSSTGRCFDIGNTVRAALVRFERSKKGYSGSNDPKTAGNGSLMRLAPVPMRYAADPAQAVILSGDSSRTTHGAQAAVDACRYFGALLVGALNGDSKETLLGKRYSPIPGLWEASPLHPAIDEVACGSFKHRQPPSIKGSGYVVEALEAALWAFYGVDAFREGCLAAVNLGDDADTTGAIYGQLAGAFYGEEAIPAGWREKLVGRKMIEEFAEKLFNLGRQPES